MIAMYDGRGGHITIRFNDGYSDYGHVRSHQHVLYRDAVLTWSYLDDTMYATSHNYDKVSMVSKLRAMFEGPRRHFSNLIPPELPPIEVPRSLRIKAWLRRTFF